jgi:hypothetical protein
MNWLERAIAFVSPAWALRRRQLRECLSPAMPTTEQRRRLTDEGWAPMTLTREPGWRVQNDGDHRPRGRH